MGTPIAPTPEELREVVALLRLKERAGLGDRGVFRLVRTWGSGEVALRKEGGQGDLLEPSSGEPPISSWLRQGIRPIPVTSSRYPPSLLELVDPPPVLFLKGREDLLAAPAVAVVGSRKATGAGRRAAETIGARLAEAGVAVVSGMALGIDGAAHRGALRAGSDTIAVLGSGFDHVYPASHRPLCREIGRQGLLLSEFLPDASAHRHHFPKRNRIIAALARAVVVVEAGKGSGALITVDHALDLGRDVLAVPGSVENARAMGSNALLRDGAGVIVDPGSIVDQLRESGVIPDRGRGNPDSGKGDALPIPRELEPLWSALGAEPRSVDEVARESGFILTETLAGLSALELGGWVRRCPGMRFARE